MKIVTVRCAYLFSGMGGAALAARHVRKHLQTADGLVEVEIVCVGAIDYDEGACAIFSELVGVEATQMAMPA